MRRAGRDAELAFNVPADGRYRVGIGDFAGQGGHATSIDSTSRAEPEFELKVPADSLAIIPGKPAELTVEIDRRNGFAETSASKCGSAARRDGRAGQIAGQGGFGQNGSAAIRGG